jgi:hypothetical protein
MNFAVAFLFYFLFFPQIAQKLTRFIEAVSEVANTLAKNLSQNTDHAIGKLAKPDVSVTTVISEMKSQAIASKRTSAINNQVTRLESLPRFAELLWERVNSELQTKFISCILRIKSIKYCSLNYSIHLIQNPNGDFAQTHKIMEAAFDNRFR